jgi:threonine dehydratase
MNHLTQVAFTLQLDDIKKAHELIKSAIYLSPCKYSYKLSKAYGTKLYIKFENMQITGSFKERGALHKLLTLNEDEKQKGVIAASAGNHAQGVAYHSGRLKIPATIVMPIATPITKVEQTRSYGAEVILAGDTYDDCYQYMLKIKKERGLTLVHPFNDPQVIAGQGTIALEILEIVPDLECFIIPIGGGGMIAGMASAAKAINPKIKIYGVQSTLFPHFYNRLHGFKTNSGTSTSLAEGIAVKNPGDLTFDIAKELIDDVLLVEDKYIEQAITELVTDEKAVAEGAGAAGLAAIIAYPQLFQNKKTAIVLCGGNIDTTLLSTVLTRSLFRQDKLFKVKMSIIDRPGFLAEIARIIADQGGNIVDVSHNRYELGMPAKEAHLSIVIEARDHTHAQKIRSTITASGVVIAN